MSRREIREHIFKLLFRLEFHKSEDMPEQFRVYFESMPEVKPDNFEYIQTKYDDIVKNINEIDECINNVARGWTTTRMGKVDLAIIRLACYEMKFDEDVPVGVAINEGVELAKIFGGDDSSAFVNGILAKLV